MLLRHSSISLDVPIDAKHFRSATELFVDFSNEPLSITSEIELIALFVHYCSTRNSAIALTVFEFFAISFFKDCSIYSIIVDLSLDEQQARNVLKGYYSMWLLTEPHGSLCIPSTLPALFLDPSASLMALFGGQGGMENYIDEVRWLLDVFRPLLNDYAARMTEFLRNESCDPRFIRLYEYGMDVRNWCAHSEKQPPSSYLLRSSVEIPITGLIQLMHLMILYKTLGIDPGDLTKYFKVAVGHSQGTVTATLLASVTDEASFYSLSEKALGILMLVGAYPELECPPSEVNQSLIKEATTQEGLPLPMMAIRGIRKEQLVDFIAEFNSGNTGQESLIYLSLINTHEQFVVSGITSSLALFVKWMRDKCAQPGENQSRILFSKRKPAVKMSYLTTIVPYHCELLHPVIGRQLAYATEKGWVFDSADLKIEIRASNDGHDIRKEPVLTRHLFECTCEFIVDFPTAIGIPSSTHIVDFSPGGFSVIGAIAYTNMKGRGIPVISTSALTAGSSSLGPKTELFKQNITDVIQAPNWQKQFAPRLVRTKHDGKLHLNTSMHRVLGHPPLMVAGMTPTTANEHFVAAIRNAGYYAELAGGSIYNEQMLKHKADVLMRESVPGQGIALNCIYVNQQLWNMQYAELLRLRKAGYPIASVCIGAGVPSPEVANEIIGNFREAGIRHVAFKPSTAASIHQVVSIAQANPDYPIILQWTGGRAGGHHSCEDFHEPLLVTYAAIRSQPNIVLVLGSGFGDAEGTLPYLTGDWSLGFGRAPMPVDGFLLASRVMIAKEAGTSSSAKELIVHTPGLSDSEWEKTCSGAHGGIITIMSEYGELMHVIATRGAAFAKEIYDSVLSRPRDQQPGLLNAMKDDIIQRLNADYMRPWFGRKVDGSVCDIEDMTYMEVASRLAALLFVSQQQRWIDQSYLDLFTRFLHRIEDRFTKTVVNYELQAIYEIGDPQEFVRHFASKYPSMETELISSEDVQYFISLCRQKGVKPVPFIPQFDEDFAVWLLKDTLWQSEYVESLTDQDIQRTFVLQGPVSVKYSTKVNEPVKNILDTIYHGQIAAVLDRFYNGDEQYVPVLEYIEPLLQSRSPPCTAPCKVYGDRHVYHLPSDPAQLPPLDSWVDELAGPQLSWFKALLTSEIVVQGFSYAENRVRQIIRPRAGQVITVFLSSLEILGLAITSGDSVQPDVEIWIDNGYTISVCIYHVVNGAVHPWELRFKYSPSTPLAMIRETNDGHDKRYLDIVRSGMVHSQCYSTEENPDSLPTSEHPICRRGFVITDELVAYYCKSVGNALGHYCPHSNRPTFAPADLLFVLATEGLFALLSAQPLCDGLLNMIHQSNRYRLEANFSLLQVGNIIDYDMHIRGITNTAAGKQIDISTAFYRDGIRIASMDTSLIFRGIKADVGQTFRRVAEPIYLLELRSTEDVEYLALKEWIVFRDHYSSVIAVGDTLEFHMNSEYRYRTDTTYSNIKTVGYIKKVCLDHPDNNTWVADIDFECCDALGNPVLSFLIQHGHTSASENMFEHSGIPIVPPGDDTNFCVKAPDSAKAYAEASCDYNPIHTNQYVADYAGLPCPVIHGMWTSASTRALIERYVADCQPERIRAFSTDFIAMVLPGDELETKLLHIGMTDGRMLVKGETRNQHGKIVLTCTAEVDQPVSVYTFAGLGSQQVRMGMDLYERSDAARAVWDRADKHMHDTYGVSLLDIVRNNPEEITVKFNGVKGSHIRRVYMSLTTESLGNQKVAKTVQLFPQVTKRSQSYTHKSRSGLLNTAQFTQPALTVFAMACIADLRSKSLIPDRAMFAGHSLGEFGALASLSSIFSIEDIVDITFYRGMLLHTSVERDGQNRSQYGMAAVNPSRVGNGFDQGSLELVIDAIRMQGNSLLELINHNVSGQQYVVAGHHSMLSALGQVLDTIYACKINVGSDDGRDDVANIIRDFLAQGARDITPKRGHSLIPLPGIDVPSHSTQLLPAVASFRKYLLDKIREDGVNYNELKHIYIPNVTARPFEVSKEYLEDVFRITRSPVLAVELNRWDDVQDMPCPRLTKLARIILVELLAYQFALPVRWIETQDTLFRLNPVRRFIEIGSVPTLAGMAERTLKIQKYKRVNVTILHVIQDELELTYSYTLESNEVSSDEVELPDMPETEMIQHAPKVAASAPPPATIPSATQAIADTPVKTLDIVQVLIALKMKRTANDISTTKTIKKLSSGKSTLQNEIASELQKEFGSKIPNKAEEMSLSDLASKIGIFNGTFGKQISSHLARMFASKIPSNYTQSTLRSHLEAVYGLGPQRHLGVLLLALTMEPPSRLQSNTEVDGWIRNVAEMYSRREGITYTADHSPSGGTAAGLANATINGAKFVKAQEEQRAHILRQVEVLACQAGIDLRQDGRHWEMARAENSMLQSEINLIRSELGEDYLHGIHPMFDAKKGRHYDSFWNWARQDLFEWVNSSLLGSSDISHERMLMLENRSHASLIDLAEGLSTILSKRTVADASHTISKLNVIIDSCRLALSSSPVFKGIGSITSPSTEITLEGDIRYTSVPRKGEPTYKEYASNMHSIYVGRNPLLHMRSQQSDCSWVYDSKLTEVYFDTMNEVCTAGLTFEEKAVLITGCGHGSIGSAILKGLLSGGAKVVATTSSYSHKTTMYFEEIYRQYGACGSELHVFPFNQGSVADIESLVDHIFSRNGLNWDLDFIIPFASVSDIGSDVASLESHSELALRVMMTNLMRLVGAIATMKSIKGLDISPSLVLVPLSPNHGCFGGDGLYGESKASLETLLNRWKSETWSKYISVIGAVIGWTRGTNMVDTLDVISYEAERRGTRTFSANEMAFNILCLLHPDIQDLANTMPLFADLDGGFQANISQTSDLLRHRSDLLNISASRRHASYTTAYDNHTITNGMLSKIYTYHTSNPLAYNSIRLPRVKSYDQLHNLHYLEGIINLDKVVVVTGYGEFGPYGHSNTRWEMEAQGKFSLEGCIELSWMMGLIRHHNGLLPAGDRPYVGWVDTSTGSPVHDRDVKAKYEPYILEHTGIRALEPATIDGADPSTFTMLREIQVAHDLEPFEVTAEEAEYFRAGNGDKVDTWENSDGSWSVKFRKDALISVQKAVPFDRTTVGQLPTGWDPKRYGIPDDIIEIADPVTIYSIISTVEALLRSGITDPYELFKYFHVSEIGNSTGSCAGGTSSMKGIFVDHMLDKEVKTDATQELFINTIAAWTNMLLMSSSGPIKATVGACGTVAMSLDVAVETIQSGKAKVMIAGASDSYSRDVASTTAQIKATADALEEHAIGRTPKEMSRPCATTRSGFVESIGSGMLMLMSGSAAIECGAPIYGVLAMTATATDKEGRTVPAPGQGILTTARESLSTIASPMLDFGYRHRKLQARLADISSWTQEEKEGLQTELEVLKALHDSSKFDDEEFVRSNEICIERKAQQMIKNAQDEWSNEFWRSDPTISPLRGSLATWGLTIDDVDMVSLHATSTVASDKNEPHVIDQQLKKLGRTHGYALPAVCQKWLTGHPRGPAAAWMLNGVIQCMQTGIVPGNRNLDNVTPELVEYSHLVFPSKSIQTPGISTALLTSFGFGQVGGEILVLHPDFVHAVLSQEALGQYRRKVNEREQKANRYWQDVLVGNHTFVQVKNAPPFTLEQESHVYMDSTARAKYDPISRTYHF